MPHVLYSVEDPFVQTAQILEMPYMRSHIDTYRGGVLADQTQALIERLHPRYADVLRRTSR